MTLEPAITATVTDGSVTFTFRVENGGDSPVELSFRSGQTADVVVYEQGGAAADPTWQWSDGRMFTQVIRDEHLPPGETITEEYTWSDPDPGEYVARGTLEATQSAEAETTFTV